MDNNTSSNEKDKFRMFCKELLQNYPKDILDINNKTEQYYQILNELKNNMLFAENQPLVITSISE